MLRGVKKMTTRRYALDGSKMEKLGWKLPIGFEESLERTVQWTAKNQKWLRETL